MESDSVIAPKLHPTKLKVVSSTRIIFNIVDLSSDGEGFGLIKFL